MAIEFFTFVLGPQDEPTLTSPTSRASVGRSRAVADVPSPALSARRPVKAGFGAAGPAVVVAELQDGPYTQELLLQGC